MLLNWPEEIIQVIEAMPGSVVPLAIFFFGNLGLKMLKLLKELEIVCSVGGKGDLPVKSVGGRWVPYIWDIWERLGIGGYTLAF